MLYRIAQFLIIILLPVLLIIGLLAAAQVARADNHVVTNANDDGDGSLRQAIADATDGDTITFAGDYTIYLNNPLTITNRLTIDGSGHTVTVSGDSGDDGSPNVRIFYIGSSGVVTLTYLSIVSGTTPNGDWTCPTYCGGGIYNDGGMLTIENSTFSGNSAGIGGGIFNGGTLTVINSIVSGNSATSDSGGGIHNNGALTVQNSTLSNNSAEYCGGSLTNGGVLTVISSTISGNSTDLGNGGGICNGRVLTIQNSTLFGNSAYYGGGGIDSGGIGAILTIQDSTGLMKIGS